MPTLSATTPQLTLPASTFGQLTPESWFQHWRPEYPLAADVLSKGVYRMKRHEAIFKRHIEVNTFGMKNLLTFDLDDDEADWTIKALVYDEGLIPEPSWWTINPESGHAHVGYVLHDGVAVSPISRKAPMEYLRDIDHTLSTRMKADPAYSKMFTRNPLHERARTHWGASQPYTLRGLHKSLGDLEKVSARDYSGDMENAGENVESRHQSLFEKASKHSHKIWYEHYMDNERKGLGRLTHEQAVIEHAVALNLQDNVSDPLPRREVESLAMSCARWTWRTFNVPDFQRIQKQRSQRQASVQERKDRVALIRELAEAGHYPTARELADTFNVSISTAHDYLQEAGVKRPELKGEALSAKVLELQATGQTWAEIALALGKSKDQVRYAAKKAKQAA